MTSEQRKFAVPLIAEFGGTALLTFTVLASLSAGSMIFTAMVAGLTLAVLFYLIGGVSGAHVNPAVTVAMLVAKKIDVQKAILYFPAQIGGAIFGHLLKLLIVGGAFPQFVFVSTVWVLIAEILGAVVFVAGVFFAISGKFPKFMDADVGLALGIGVLFGGVVSGAGVINPAIAFSIGNLTIAHIFGPLIGAVLVGFFASRVVGVMNKGYDAASKEVVEMEKIVEGEVFAEGKAEVKVVKKTEEKK